MNEIVYIPKNKFNKSHSISNKLAVIILWLFLSTWIWFVSKKIVESYKISDLKLQKKNFFELLENKFKDFFDTNNSSNIVDIMDIIYDIYYKFTNTKDVTDFLYDIKNILKISKNNILFISLVNSQWITYYDTFLDKNIITQIFEENKNIWNEKFFKEIEKLDLWWVYISDIENFSYEKDWKKINTNIPSISVIKKVHMAWSYSWYWYIMVVLKINLFNDYFITNNLLFNASNSIIQILNPQWDVLFSNYQKSFEWNIDKNQHTFKIWKWEYSIKLDINLDDILETNENIKISVLISLFFWFIYFWYYNFYLSQKEKVNRILKFKDIKLKDYIKLLESTIEAIPYPIFFKDEYWKYIWCNKKYIEKLWISREKLLWLTVEDIDIPDEHKKLHIEYDKILIEKWSIQPYQITQNWSNWERIYMMNKWLLKKWDWTIWWIIWIMIDITELKEKEKQAIIADKAKSDFLANMSHELRTPLNAIIWFSESMTLWVHWKLEQPKYIEYIHDINFSWKMLLKLIDEILIFSKINSWEISIDKNNLLLKDVFDVCISLLKLRIKKSKLSVIFDIEENLFIRADDTKIKQIILNILTNSIKHTPENWKIFINCYYDDRFNTIIEIEDTWLWIAEENISKVLLPFYQVKESYIKSKEWTWLWLPLSKTLVELHSWKFEISSELWKWTKIIMTFPRDIDNLNNIW
jgi:PAS domain S-box-containing protein